MFIELSLLDLERFIAGVSRTLPEVKAFSVMNKVKRFALYQTLDSAFDSLMVRGFMINNFLEPEQIPPWHIYKYGPEIQDALYNLFELIRNKFENNIEQFNEVLAVIMQELALIFENPDVHKIPEDLRRFGNEIK